jgi:hypothetical protein
MYHELRTASKRNKRWLAVDDVAYAQRLAKALKHAVELGKGFKILKRQWKPKQLC